MKFMAVVRMVVLRSRRPRPTLRAQECRSDFQSDRGGLEIRPTQQSPYAKLASFHFHDHFDFHGPVAGQGDGAKGASGADAVFQSQYIGEELAATVDYRRVIL